MTISNFYQTSKPLTETFKPPLELSNFHWNFRISIETHKLFIDRTYNVLAAVHFVLPEAGLRLAKQIKVNIVCPTSRIDFYIIKRRIFYANQRKRKDSNMFTRSPGKLQESYRQDATLYVLSLEQKRRIIKYIGTWLCRGREERKTDFWSKMNWRGWIMW